MIKTVIMGTGRMGSLIRTTAESIVDAAGQPVFDIVAQIGFDLSELENAPAADVIIDFSNAATFDAVVAYVERTGAALVSGTTGYTPEQMDRLRELGQNTRVMHSGNYSIGIAALRHLVAQATRELPGFDCEIVETHHNQKVDAPSGTAKLLLDAVAEAEPEAGYHPVYGRELALSFSLVACLLRCWWLLCWPICWSGQPCACNLLAVPAAGRRRLYWWFSSVYCY